MNRHGWTGVVAAALAVAIGRVFAVVELYVIGAGIGAAVLAGWLTVGLRRPRITVERWIHPPILTVGDTGRVDLAIRNPRRLRSPRLTAVEPVGRRDTARIELAPLDGGERVEAAYRIPANRRGVLEIGPLVLERRDLFGVAVARRVAAPMIDVVVAPRTHELPMPDLGRGLLGRHLLTQAQRLGSSEFHSLRDYQSGDELRLVDWKASARSHDLKVRQHTTDGVRRCIVVLDLRIDRDGNDGADHDAPHDEDGSGDGTNSGNRDDDAFERGVTAAASLVQSADRAGLTTRFVTASGIDLRGPEVASATLRVLARIEPDDHHGRDPGDGHHEIERDPGEGLGLVIVITPSPTSAAWRRAESLLDPTLTRVGIFTDAAGASAGGRLSVDASSTDRFLAGWDALAGRGGLDVRAGPAEHAGVTA
ncbi:MAG: DUF58 domain-containing protein [Ilumatobacteraceae bacterium]